MKNRTLILNDLTRMQENNVSFIEMVNKLQHFAMSYYESLNMLHEVTNKPLQDISEELLKNPYWQEMKEKTDEKEEALNTEYSAIMHHKKIKQKSFDQAIEESYLSVLDSKKQKEKRLKSLDKSIMEMIQ